MYIYHTYMCTLDTHIHTGVYVYEFILYWMCRGIEKDRKRSEKEQETWEVSLAHPSRLDLTTGSEAEETPANTRTDRFTTERFKREERGRRFGEGGEGGGGTRGRGWRGGRRWERRSEGDARGWREEGRRGGQDVGRREEHEPSEEGMEQDGEGRGRVTGERRGRGRGNWRAAAREQEAMEREERVFREKKLLDSLTDPRDVPKGSSYFEVDKYYCADVVSYGSVQLLMCMYNIFSI